MSGERTVPLSEAERQVRIVVQRLALMHLAYARTLVDRLGWRQARQLILDSIKRYGQGVAARAAQGHQSLPDYGFWERREGRPGLCELGKVMLEMGEPELGSMYCLVDAAKTMAADPARKMVHTRCMILGHDECAFATVATTEPEASDFASDHDWSYVDPLIADFLPPTAAPEPSASSSGLPPSTRRPPSRGSTP
jgi:hypothetical protein